MHVSKSINTELVSNYTKHAQELRLNKTTNMLLLNVVCLHRSKHTQKLVYTHTN